METTHALDPDQQLLIGGDTGLRGYPLGYESGTSRGLLTVEQRFYTDWYPFAWRVLELRYSAMSAALGAPASSATAIQARLRMWVWV